MRKGTEVVYSKGQMKEMFSDASYWQVGGACFTGDKADVYTVFKVTLAKGERMKSSTYRELCAI